MNRLVGIIFLFAALFSGLALDVLPHHHHDSEICLMCDDCCKHHQSGPEHCFDKDLDAVFTDVTAIPLYAVIETLYANLLPPATDVLTYYNRPQSLIPEAPRLRKTPPRAPPQ